MVNNYCAINYMIGWSESVGQGKKDGKVKGIHGPT